MVDSPAHGRELYEKLMRVCHRFLGITPAYFGYVPNDDYVRQAIRRQATVVEAFPSSPVGARFPAPRPRRRRLGSAGAARAAASSSSWSGWCGRIGACVAESAMTPGYKTAAAAGLPPADELVLQHGELVKRIAYHVVSRLPAHIEVDDLIQAGMIGLLNAAQNFAPTKGANFETYAGIRIRGAMLDEARRSNWTPRSTFRNAKQVSLAIRSIENRTGRDAKAQEIAGTLGVSLEEYHRMVESAASSRILSYEQLAGDPERASMLPEAPEDGPETMLEEDQFREALAARDRGAARARAARAVALLRPRS